MLKRMKPFESVNASRIISKGIFMPHRKFGGFKSEEGGKPRSHAFGLSLNGTLSSGFGDIAAMGDAGDVLKSTPYQLGVYVRLCIGIMDGKILYQISDQHPGSSKKETWPSATTKSLRLIRGHMERSYHLQIPNDETASDDECVTRRDFRPEDVNSPASIEYAKRLVNVIRDNIFLATVNSGLERMLEKNGDLEKLPLNHAKTKAQLINFRDIAWVQRNLEDVALFTLGIQDLEELTQERENKRQPRGVSVSYINYKNRKRNIEETEKAILEEARANKRAKIQDPFTRRRTKPRKMSQTRKRFQSDDEEPDEVEDEHELEGSVCSEKEKEDPEPVKNGTDLNGIDLYAVHDFELDLELSPELPNNIFVVNQKK